jgi:hypothetical protein
LVKLANFEKGDALSSSTCPCPYIFLSHGPLTQVPPSELGALLAMKAAYGAGGAFEPDWCVVSLDLAIFSIAVSDGFR